MAPNNPVRILVHAENCFHVVVYRDDFLTRKGNPLTAIIWGHGQTWKPIQALSMASRTCIKQSMLTFHQICVNIPFVGDTLPNAF